MEVKQEVSDETYQAEIIYCNAVDDSPSDISKIEIKEESKTESAYHAFDLFLKEFPIKTEIEQEEFKSFKEKELNENENEVERAYIEDNVDQSSEEDDPEETRNYFYGRNRYKWSKNPPTSNRGRPSQKNIVLELPGLRPAAKIVDSADPLQVWKLLFSDNICNIFLRRM
uniref:Uncharacterized protein LOC114344834 n=1 Tax=Diabrotica virgifera virgifera TaxID=50390 RepID=A0A6P7H164_DIAVI